MQGLPYDERHLDDPAAQARFCRENNVNSFPQVFAAGVLIGGHDDTKAWIQEGNHL